MRSPPLSTRARTHETRAESGATLKPESPSPRNAASTRCSVLGFAKANSRLIATASAPLARTASARAASSSSVGSRRISPSALTRSATPNRSSLGTKTHWDWSKPVVEPRPRLPSNCNRVFKSRSRHERHARAGTLQHRIGAHGRSVAHLHIVRAAELLHAFQHRSRGVSGRRKNLLHAQLSVRQANAVGKRAAGVDCNAQIRRTP